MLTRDKYIEHIARSLPHSLTEDMRGWIALQMVDIYMKDIKDNIDFCARVAEHQAEICGRSMSRQSTAHDIAFNIRNLILSDEDRIVAEKQWHKTQQDATLEMLKENT